MRTDGDGAAAPLFAAQEAKARPTADRDRRGKWKRRSTNATRVQRSAAADELTQTSFCGAADFPRAVLLRQSALLEGVATEGGKTQRNDSAFCLVMSHCVESQTKGFLAREHELNNNFEDAERRASFLFLLFALAHIYNTAI